MASEFTRIRDFLPLSAIGYATLLKKLNPIQLFVYNMVFSLCFKGTCYKRMREISYIYVANELNRLYGLNLSKRQVRRSIDKMVSMGLIERKTACFVKEYNGMKLPTKASYYRLSLP